MIVRGGYLGARYVSVELTSIETVDPLRARATREDAGKSEIKLQNKAVNVKLDLSHDADIRDIIDGRIKGRSDVDSRRFLVDGRKVHLHYSPRTVARPHGSFVIVIAALGSCRCWC